MRKICLMLLVALLSFSVLSASDVKPLDEVNIISEVPIREKGYSFDPENPYLPPVSGLGNNLSAGGATYSVYVPSDFAPWSPGVIILAPDGVSAEEFALSDLGRTWMAAADKNSFALGFVESSKGGWNTTGDETRRNDIDAVEAVYTQMRSKSQNLSIAFTMDKSRVTLVGYEEGAAMALAVAAASSATFSAVVAIDAVGVDISYIQKCGERYCFPFPGDGMKAQNEVALVSSTLAMPVWFIGESDEAAIEYYMDVNEATAYAYNDYASIKYNPSNTVEAVWINTDSESLDPDVIWDEFISIHTRPLGVEGGHLAFAMTFDTRADGKGYIYTEEEFDGLKRKYMTYVPSSYDGSESVPLVMVIHGYTATMYALAEESKWCDIAEENNIIIVLPQGYPNPNANPANIPAPSWMVPALFGDAEGADDVAFLLHVLDETKKNYNIDESRMYCTGHSNGCAMTLALASASPETFAAIAPIGFSAAGLVDSIEGTVIPLSLYYGQYDSAVNSASLSRGVEYWTRINGLESAPTALRASSDGRFITTSYLTDDGVPLVEFTYAANSAHAYFPQESQRIWDEFLSHYTRVGSSVFYDGVLVN